MEKTIKQIKISPLAQAELFYLEPLTHPLIHFEFEAWTIQLMFLLEGEGDEGSNSRPLGYSYRDTELGEDTWMILYYISNKLKSALQSVWCNSNLDVAYQVRLASGGWSQGLGAKVKAIMRMARF